ncbi:MAG: S1 RNA-binding domain-containing protein, partial [Ruthenibacterium sp.]
IIEEVLSSMSDEIREEELSFEEMLEGTLKPVYAGKVVSGIVTAVSPNEVQVDIGTKQTGFIKLEELTNDPSAKAEDLVKKGDELDLVVTKVNDQEGVIYLSKKRLDENKGKEAVAAAVDSGEIMEGYVTESNSGGVVALVNNVRVFIPRSQATLRHGEDYTALVKQTVKMKIKQCEGRHIVGSIREVLAEQVDGLREKFWEDVEVGKKYIGTVKSLTNYGAFVDIGGVDGLVHISELAWNRIKHPSEVVNVGDKIDVYVKDLDIENKKVSLGYKKDEDNPWEKFKAEYPIGSTFKAPVVSVTKFGAFVRIIPGIDGLVHISEISHDRVEKVSDVLTVGQEVEVVLTDVDYDKKRISLSMKALIPEPEAGDDTSAATEEAAEAAPEAPAAE